MRLIIQFSGSAGCFELVITDETHALWVVQTFIITVS
jgi:hypothetical protein